MADILVLYPCCFVGVLDAEVDEFPDPCGSPSVPDDEHTPYVCALHSSGLAP